LNSQLLFAPAYMIMTWIVITLASGMKIDSSKWTGLVSSTPSSSVDLLFGFIVIIAMSIASILISKGISTKGAGEIGKLTDMATKFAGNRIMGTAGAVGRKTVGWAGNAVANNETLKATMAKGGTVGWIAKQTIKGADRTAKSSFDIRSTSLGGGIIKSMGVDFDKGADRNKVNYQKDVEAKAEKEAKYAKMLKPSDDATDKAKDEKAREAGYDNYEQWKKADEDKKKDYESAKTDLSGLKKEEEELEKSKEAATTEAELDEIQRKVNEKREEIKEKETLVKNLQTESEKLVTARKAADDAIKGIFAERVTSYAKSFAEESAYWTWTKNILKVGGGGLMAVGTARTPAENRAIARAIQKVAKEKTPDEVIAEQAAKKAAQERKARIASGNATPEDTEGTPAPAAPPPPPPVNPPAAAA